MDSNKIKNLAFGARDALRAEIAGRLDMVLAEDSPERLDQPNAVAAIETVIKEQGNDHVVDAAAYTWFNRLCALRFMDANGYTPVPVVTPRSDATQPAILADATQGVFDPEFNFNRLDRDRISSLLMGTTPSNNPTEAAYTQLLNAVCRHYSGPMPYLFKEEVASSLLMPQGLLSEGSILRRIVEDMDDDNCTSVEVLGWLYQYYIAERKDEIMASSKKRGADEIAPVTQLFTPNWIVRYMTENSLGRIWMLNNPGSSLQKSMDYFIDSEIPDEYLKVYSAEELKVLDPACGSGHILVYAFDLLFKMYEEEGWQPEDIPAMILKNNLFGFEIDSRAGEIAKFALEMKAREKDPRFFDKRIDAMVTVLEPIRFTEDELDEAGLLAGNVKLLEVFEHLDEVGSLYLPDLSDEVFIDNALENINARSGMFAQVTTAKLCKMKEQVQKLSQKFSAVIANPPYISPSTFEPWAKKWVQNSYPDEKSDVCVCFINRGFSFAEKLGLSSMITMQSWMFLDSYKEFRTAIVSNYYIHSLLHLGAHAFDSIGGEIVQTAVFTIANKKQENSESVFFDLTCYDSSDKKRSAFLNKRNQYSTQQNLFLLVPDSRLAYWLSSAALSAFKNEKLCGYGDSFQGIITGEVDKHLRLWHEISFSKISFHDNDHNVLKTANAYYPYTKGGQARKWYGNNDYLIRWLNDGRHFTRSRVNSRNLFLRSGITWSLIGGTTFAFREFPVGFLCDVSGSPFIANEKEDTSTILAALNSTITPVFLRALNPTTNTNINDILAIPIPDSGWPSVKPIVDGCVSASKSDWDSFETSWDFEQHPLAPSLQERTEQLNYGMNAVERWESVSLIDARFARWSDECQQRFDTLKSNEEKLNRIFAKIYHMEGEVPVDVPDDKVSVRRADVCRDIKSLVSYGIGCLFGRYSTNRSGLVLANQGSTAADFDAIVPDTVYPVDEDGILPVLDGEWFADDIVSEFKKWLSAVYGSDTLVKNVTFIEDTLGKDLRSYFVKDFYADHVQIYKKRPIYWLFSSPKKSFSVLIYLHRYTPSTVGQILTGYLREYIEKLNGSIEALDMSERNADKKQADTYRAVVKELTAWERDVIYPLANERIAIDLDDGVKVNYNKFPHALRKVTGLSEWK